jgi:DNA-binding NtrC family response regulator
VKKQWQVLLVVADGATRDSLGGLLRLDGYTIETALPGAAAEQARQMRAAHPEAEVLILRPFDEDEAVVPAGGSLADMEKVVIAATLRRTGGNIKESAAILDIDRSTLYEKIRKYQIPRMRRIPGAASSGA